MKVKRTMLLTVMAVILLGGWCACAKAPEAPVKAVELKVSTYGPPNDERWTQIVLPLTAEIEKRTKGRIKFTYYPGGALAGPTEVWDACVSGSGDIFFGYQFLTFGHLNLWSAYSLPFMGIKDIDAGNHILWQLYKTVPEMKAEFDGVKLLMLQGHGPAIILTSKKPIRTMEDLKGLKIRGLPGPSSEALKALGAVPVSLAMTEAYDALAKGVIDGALSTWEGIAMLRFHEVTKYAVDCRLMYGFFYLIMNEDSWNSLSQTDQKVFDGLFGENSMDLCIKVESNKDAAGKKALTDAGGTIIELPPAEMERWIKVTQPIRDKWVADMKAKGLPAEKVFAETLKAIQKYSK